MPIVKFTNEVNYIDKDNQKAKIIYYSLSDYSLHYAKIFINDVFLVALPQIISGAGVRYTDGYRYTLWVQGEKAYLERPNRNKEWEVYIVFTQVKEDDKVL
ncbi:MAG: MliC family protein [Treponemataceae bacterium]